MINQKRLNEELRNIVSQLINLYKPQKIILFGSLANGKIGEGTDIDLFIIKNNIPKYGIDRIRQLDLLIKYKYATDFIVYKSSEVKQRIKLGDPFIKSIIEDGKILYEAK